jgi:hypothetical protein
MRRRSPGSCGATRPKPRLAVPATAVVTLGPDERRTLREIVLALVGSVVCTVAFVIALIDYTISRLPPDFFN